MVCDPRLRARRARSNRWRVVSTCRTGPCTGAATSRDPACRRRRAPSAIGGAGGGGGAGRWGRWGRAGKPGGRSHVLTAHTRDDQAETLLMRLLRGSGIAGLAAMARESEREGLRLARPFLDVPKSQLIATLKKAKVEFAEDPSNRDISFTRPRLRTLM